MDLTHLNYESQLQWLVETAEKALETWDDGSTRGWHLRELRRGLTQLAESPQGEVEYLTRWLPRLQHPSRQRFLDFLAPARRSVERLSQRAALDSLSPKGPFFDCVWVLDNLRSGFNVGSILRTAEALHSRKVWMCGYTPTPDHDSVLRSSMGSHEMMEWEKAEETLDVLRSLKGKRTLIALEEGEGSVSMYSDWQPEGPLAVVVGNERFGIGAAVREACDFLVSLPMDGRKNSLNVANAVAIAGYHLKHGRKNKKNPEKPEGSSGFFYNNLDFSD